MAYTAPTVEEFKTRFPTVVAGRSDALLQMDLDEANRSVDDSWLEGDYKNAIMYLAAHNITMEKAGEGAGGGGGVGSGAVSSESFGGMSISYDNSKSANDAAANSQWGGTEYGQRFYRLLKLNKIPIVSI